MSSFVKRVNRRVIHFSNHALDRWWERCRQNQTTGRKEAIELLRRSLEESREQRTTPTWYAPSRFHKATTHHFVSLDGGERGFVVMKNPSGDFVAVTYIDKEMTNK